MAQLAFGSNSTMVRLNAGFQSPNYFHVPLRSHLLRPRPLLRKASQAGLPGFLRPSDQNDPTFLTSHSQNPKRGGLPLCNSLAQPEALPLASNNFSLPTGRLQGAAPPSGGASSRTPSKPAGEITQPEGCIVLTKDR